MRKARRLLELCMNESSTSTEGKVPHSHPEEFDDNGVLIGVGTANTGPKHDHMVRVSDQGDVDILPAGNTDPEDPTHDHEPSDAAKKSTKDAYLKQFDKETE